MSFNSFVSNQGTQTPILTDNTGGSAGTVIAVQKVDISPSGTAGTIWNGGVTGTINSGSIVITTGTIASVGTIGTVGLATISGTLGTIGTITNIGQVSNAGTLQLGTVVGNIAAGSADLGNPIKVGGVYHASDASLADGQRYDLRVNNQGKLWIYTNDVVQTNVTDNAGNTNLTAAAQTAVTSTQGMGAGAFEIQGTYVGTIAFEANVDQFNSGTWAPIIGVNSVNGAVGSTTSGTGIYRFSVGGLQAIQARMASYASGTAYVIYRAGAGNYELGLINGGTINAATISGNIGTIGTIGLATVTGNLGTMGTLGLVNTVATISNLSAGSINVVAGTIATLGTMGTLGLLANGTLASSGTTTGVGTVTNLGSVTNVGQIYNAGTLQGGSIAVTAGTFTDASLYIGGSSAASAGSVIVKTDVSGYKAISLQIGGTWTGQVNFQASNDGTTWYDAPMNATGNRSNQYTNNTTANALFNGPVVYRYFQAVGNTIASGTATGTAILSSAPDTPYTMSVTASQNGGYNVALTSTTTGTIPFINTVGTLNSGTINTGTFVMTTGTLSAGTLNAATITSGTINTGTFALTSGTINVGTFQANPIPAQNILTIGTVGTTAIGTLVAAPGVGTSIYVTSFSVDGDSSVLGTAECCLAFGSATTGSQVLFRATLATLNDVAMQSFAYPVNAGVTNLPLTYQIISGAGSVSWNAQYFVH